MVREDYFSPLVEYLGGFCGDITYLFNPQALPLPEVAHRSPLTASDRTCVIDPFSSVPRSMFREGECQNQALSRNSL